ncbi:hypothetical protein vBValSR12Z_71 [Vibrio phage vB_ValS_R12Z]|uniref:Uncharacterized protein n=7 Tax=root TaxID=1 RepID=A0A384WK68_9CAUD|nr:hypothetical protein [Vibrio alginolyticus]YP_009598661.1 hypothetical protein FDH27_gp070 [Vibrio phage SSP002]ATI19380.1 hypothetical protein KF5_070 [Vibrio phage vB_VpaS_KF5]ATI19474.1 hypothetical protein KF6_066 [Vibrio phage vB_VpaS_KF6]AUM58732.1 hypothetical protein VVP001_032 [Vibrio phage VVP001]QAY01749.1 hypothetical protein ValLY3_24 [Vibrio phage ValLY_3]QEP53439.1 hypothetical protein HCMJ_71 [Vibrio phage vB_VpaS_HCMJ]QYW05967.1 hypothetical protein [Vibrio phage vB_VpS_C
MAYDVGEQAIRSFKNRLRIDKNDLDNELVEQSHLFFEVSERLTWAKAERDEVKRECDELAGELKADLFAENPKLADTKATAIVKKDPDYQERYREKSDADRIVGAWEALVEAFKSRGYMLRQLADLYVANYYSPISGGESQDDKRRKRAERDDRSNRRRTRRT